MTEEPGGKTPLPLQISFNVFGFPAWYGCHPQKSIVHTRSTIDMAERGVKKSLFMLDEQKRRTVGNARKHAGLATNRDDTNNRGKKDD